MTVIELVTKFKILLQLCLRAATTEREKVRRLIKALRPEISVHVDHEVYPLANIEECYHAALQVEYHLRGYILAQQPQTKLQAQSQANVIRNQNQNKPTQNQNWKGNNKKRGFQGQNQKGQSGQPSRQNNKQAKRTPCSNCNKFHSG